MKQNLKKIEISKIKKRRHLSLITRKPCSNFFLFGMAIGNNLSLKEVIDVKRHNMNMIKC